MFWCKEFIPNLIISLKSIFTSQKAFVNDGFVLGLGVWVGLLVVTLAYIDGLFWQSISGVSSVAHFEFWVLAAWVVLFRYSFGNLHQNIALIICLTWSWLIHLGSSAVIAISTAFAILPHIPLFSLTSIHAFLCACTIVFSIPPFIFPDIRLRELIFCALVLLLTLSLLWCIRAFLHCTEVRILSCWVMCYSVSLSVFLWFFFLLLNSFTLGCYKRCYWIICQRSVFSLSYSGSSSWLEPNHDYEFGGAVCRAWVVCILT